MSSEAKPNKLVLEKLADWKHQEAMLYEGAALGALTGNAIVALTADDPRKLTASGLALVFTYRLLEEANIRKSEAEAMLSKLHGGIPVERRLPLREFIRHPIGQLSLLTTAIALIRLLLILLEHR